MHEDQLKKSRPPHYGVYTRLGCSEIHGVGVFAIRPIKKGTHIFYGDEPKIVWISKQKLRGVPRTIKKLYEDFAIIKDDGALYGCPENFNLLTVSWYINESDNPNIGCDIAKNYSFYALRDIESDEELTVNYSSYSELPGT